MDSYIAPAPFHKRVLAAIFDITAVAILTVVSFLLIATGTVEIGFHNEQYTEAQLVLAEESGLFNIEKDDDGNYISIEKLTYDVTYQYEYTRFINILKNYYTNYLEKDKKSDYDFNVTYMHFNPETNENAVFSIYSTYSQNYSLLPTIIDVSTGGTVSSNQKGYGQAIANFFMDEKCGVYYTVVTNEFPVTNQMNRVFLQLYKAWFYEVVVSLTVSAFLLLSIPTIINKNGETLFMLAFGVCYVDMLGFRVKWRYKILRAFMILLFYFTTLFTADALLTVNMFLSIFRKQHRSLLDGITKQIAVDKKNSVIFDE